MSKRYPKTFQEFYDNDTVLTPEEKAQIEARVELMSQLIEARDKNGLTQKELGALANIKQSMVARVEKADVDPRISTIYRLLEPMGYTLAVVPKDSDIDSV